MITIQLNEEEQDLVEQVLQNSLATLEVEIRHAKHHDFKDLLKKRRTLLNQVLTRLEAPVPLETR